MSDKEVNDAIDADNKRFSPNAASVSNAADNRILRHIQKKRREQKPPVSPSDSSDLLSAIREHDEISMTGVDIPQDDASEPMYELVIRGPERLLVKLFNEMLRGRGHLTIS